MVNKKTGLKSWLAVAKKIIYLFIICSCLTATVTITARSQPGSLDPTFGTGGKVITDFASADDSGNSIAVQDDGKIVLAGYSHNGSNYDFGVVRYNSDGSPDSDFGTAGKVITPIGSSNDYGLSAAIQGDNKIVVSGYSFNGINNDFAVVRYNTDGSLDSTFGTDGKVTTALGSFGEVAYDMVLQSDDKIILAGYTDTTSSNFFALVRYNGDGSLDGTFGSDGIVTTHIGTSNDQCYSVTLQSDGKIVASGYSYNGTDDDFALVRYNPDGSLDNTFDFDGIVTTPIGTSDEECYGVTIQPDGKIVGAGYDVNYFTEFAVVRYNSDGSLDTTFGSGGIVTTNVGGNDNDANEVAIESDGKIVVAGNSLNATNWDFGLVRYNSDGSLDSTFGTFGKVLTDFGGGNDFCLSLVFQNDHKIVAAGFGTGIGRDFVAARYDAGAVGIEENNFINSFSVYPNPAANQLEINSRQFAISSMEIYDVLGEKAFQSSVIIPASKISVDVSSLAPGIYFIQISNEQEVVTRKVLIN